MTLPFPLGDEERDAALAALQAMNVTIRGLRASQIPALALFVASLDAVVDTATDLLILAERESPQHREKAVVALRDAMSILTEFLNAQIEKRPYIFDGNSIEWPSGRPN